MRTRRAPSHLSIFSHSVYSFLTTQSNSTDALIGRGCIRSGVTINPKTLLLAIFLGTLLLAFLVRPAHPTHARPRTAAPVASYRSEMTGTSLGRRKSDICLPNPQAFACPLWETTRYRVSGLYQSHGRELCQYPLSLTCVSHNARSSFGLCAL